MARGGFQETICAIAGDGTMKAISNVQVTVHKINNDGSQGAPAVLYEGRTGAAQVANPIITGSAGLVQFYADPGEYVALVHDLDGSPRIADWPIAITIAPMLDSGIPSAKLAQDAGVELGHLGSAVLRQVPPVGVVEDWWRPVSTYPVPTGWAICNGQTIQAADHDFGTGAPIVLPDLRNKFILGADTLIADGASGSAGDGTAASGVAHPNAPGIGGAGGLNVKDISHQHGIVIAAHSHGMAHTHSLSGHVHLVWADTGGANAAYYSAGANPGTNPNNNNHNHTIVSYTGGPVDGSSNSLNVTGASSVSSTNSGGAVNQDSNTAGSATQDFRPRYAGLLKIMKVKRS